MRSEPETSTSENALLCDIFCAVVDNYGDIGVCWRLSRQLAAEHRYRVRLWVDDPASLQKICPQLDMARDAQKLFGVEVRRWTKNFPVVEPARLVIEAFACQLPESYIQAMAVATSKPVWVNLEYLSAEAWVKDCHALASPHPRLPLIKHFFFPGFEPGTGGLLAEKGLQCQRKAFQESAADQANFWRSFGLDAASHDEFRVSLFCYQNAPVRQLLSIWADASQPVTCLVPEGVATEQLSQFFNQARIGAGTAHQKNRLTVRVYPFLEQDQYDKLLWGCQLNFVRGEDSFVRAQWASRPMVWQIYPQQEDAHWPKLQAFLDNYTAGLGQDAGEAYAAFIRGWNRGEVTEQGWNALRKQYGQLELQARQRPAKLLQLGDLTTNLVKFFKNRIQ